MRYCGSAEEGITDSAWRRIMEGFLEVVCVRGTGRHWNFVPWDEEFTSKSRLLAASFPHLPLGPSPSRALVHPARLSILFTTHRPEDKTKGLAVVIDARKQPPHPGLVSALQATQVSGRWTASASQVLRAPGTLGYSQILRGSELGPGTQVGSLSCT